MPKIVLGYCDKVDVDLAKKIAQQWQFEYIGDVAAIKQRDDIDFLLQVDQQVLSLKKLDEPKLGGIVVDFVEGASAHRRKFGGGRGQDIAKAVGLKHGFTPSVLDATAGLGRDAFVLASLGCNVTLNERVPAVAALLENGLSRANLSTEIAPITKNMVLRHGSSIDAMTACGEHDVVYLDPMYPHREKSAAVKKEMRVFQTLVGEDLDADDLFEPAYALAKYRVVVKRPNYADFIAGKKPSMSIKMKKNRFDVYVKQAIPKG
ncbi:ribosomal RNA small subunit methyltransferase J [Thalassotalea loyana]|uniref:Ribosomal RNA small subunit methyltransferase J n=1 Tax=Thalassotalea loyana TaxID=280483 RepID=A0ABQ6HAH5_9GAMM|nr:class I SAM-dependent methyltransferase [Thalassotalea loyana]GLX83770.1 ribosomal RNA small subunit methyltransferase J [Thalassotalea loyana]